MDEVAGAVADPVRREILLMLRDERLTAGQIAERFAISRPAVSRHLRVLREAGLVRDTADGRRRVYELVTAPIEELAGWLGRLTAPTGWQHRLDALETEVHRTRRERQRSEAADEPASRPHPERSGTAAPAQAGTTRATARRAHAEERESA
ncbi:metalloregulator ArsR/SmtB family transcription factor [Actinoplanes sp. NPDC020271]|uniref:metalloregulator ArsR/SmtB family transcription factor n=1 Tax=Actinoplanes sp. NPDC020271 TaxID=3363896 RepID=UPI0037A0D1E1